MIDPADILIETECDDCGKKIHASTRNLAEYNKASHALADHGDKEVTFIERKVEARTGNVIEE